MAKKQVMAEPEMIAIPRAEAEMIMDLFTNVEAADAHFQRCQSDLFRQHVQSCYRAPLVDQAYQHLKEQLNHEEE